MCGRVLCNDTVHISGEWFIEEELSSIYGSRLQLWFVCGM